ncbi:MAG TPA: response regulator [Caldimonas sp.]|nr:response regulator [Caldimonas sp.]
MTTRRDKKQTGRILVVEDDWDILEVLKLMLEDEGHHVVTAKHGRAALAAAAAKSFDLVVMDISMPEMSGIDVARELRADPKTADVYIVVHTGLDEHWVRERFADYDLFLTKAQDADVLVERIAGLLAQPRAERRQAAAEPARFSADDLMRAQHALRQGMGLGNETYPLDTFLGLLGEDIAQLRRLERSDADIAELISGALGRPITAGDLPN